jgi:hypothetical protein
LEHKPYVVACATPTVGLRWATASC